METNTKKIHVEFERLEVVTLDGYTFDGNYNKNDLYPHDGVFLMTTPDGVMSIVNVVLDKSASPTPYCSQFQQCFIGCPNCIDSDNVMNTSEYNKKLEEMSKTYEADYNRKKTELENNFDKRFTELEHEYEMKNLQLEYETPKRNSQGEWVSGKTLTEIIRTLTANNKD